MIGYGKTIHKTPKPDGMTCNSKKVIANRKLLIREINKLFFIIKLIFMNFLNNLSIEIDFANISIERTCRCCHKNSIIFALNIP